MPSRGGYLGIMSKIVIKKAVLLNEIQINV